jgi:glycine cleavage system H protein
MAQIASFHVPDELYYHAVDLLWLRLEGAQARIGLNQMSQASAGQIRHVRLMPPGRARRQGQNFGSMEAGKYVGPLRMPVSGKVVEINEAVMHDPGLINRDPYGEGWLVLIEPSGLTEELAGLVHGEAVQPWLEATYQQYQAKGLLAES